jgi:hypothetical protein
MIKNCVYLCMVCVFHPLTMNIFIPHESWYQNLVIFWRLLKYRSAYITISYIYTSEIIVSGFCLYIYIDIWVNCPGFPRQKCTFSVPGHCGCLYTQRCGYNAVWCVCAQVVRRLDLWHLFDITRSRSLSKFAVYNSLVVCEIHIVMLCIAFHPQVIAKCYFLAI